ncbi:hypothetical protein [Pseudomonas asplenii]|uniref:hypothetical protein n=1 Tax=Pseudomonas asplenii TaxID=53407 RepID=UPI0012FAE44C|nr:hypothetical protein [Pseudomonas fuscovaginae]
MKVEDFELTIDDQMVERERARLAESLGYLTESQLAMLAGVKKSTLESWRKRSKGPVSILFGNEPLYSIGNVKTFFEALTHEKSDRSHIRATL